jgi:hypothetical protein
MLYERVAWLRGVSCSEEFSVKLLVCACDRVGRTLRGTGHHSWRGVAPKRNVFLGKNFGDPTIKKPIFLPNLKYQFKNKYPSKSLQKDTVQLSHMSFTTSVIRV